MSLFISRVVDRAFPAVNPRHHDLLRTRAVIIDRTPDPARGEHATFVSIALADPSGWWVTTADRGGLIRVVWECAALWLGHLARRGADIEPPRGWEDRLTERARREGVI